MDGLDALILVGLGALALAWWSSVPAAAPSAPSASWFGNVTGTQAQTPVSNDVDTLARTIYGEARGSGQAAQQAVASVVMNRVRAGRFPGGRSVAGVCRAPFQFSCWNAGDPNRPVILSVTSSNVIFAQCLQIAQAAIAGTLSDNTGGATFYHDGSISTPSAWGQVQQTASIGGLEFFG